VIGTTQDSLGRIWANELLPLTVLYSPILRLRFRAAFSCCCYQVNSAGHKKILREPQEATNKLAVGIEREGLIPPKGVVYIKDCKQHNATKGVVTFYKEDESPISAIVELPESETSPCLTLQVTLEEICHLLGVSYIESCDSPEQISQQDILKINALYNSTYFSG
jgi:hypothetical protein